MIIKTSTGCEHAGYFCYSENRNWFTQNLEQGHMPLAGTAWT